MNTRTAKTTTSAIRKFRTTSLATKTSAASTPDGFGFWSVQVVVQAELVGQAELDFGASSADESCDDDNPECENSATVELSAVAAVTTTATTAPATTSTSTISTTPAVSSAISSNGSTGTAVLADTGFHATPWVSSAGAIILLGVGLMVLGAPRRRAYGPPPLTASDERLRQPSLRSSGTTSAVNWDRKRS